MLYSFGDRLVELLDQFSTIRASVWWVKVICDALSTLRAFRFWHSTFTSRGLSQLLLLTLIFGLCHAPCTVHVGLRLTHSPWRASQLSSCRIMGFIYCCFGELPWRFMRSCKDLRIVCPERRFVLDNMWCSQTSITRMVRRTGAVRILRSKEVLT